MRRAMRGLAKKVAGFGERSEKEDVHLIEGRRCDKTFWGKWVPARKAPEGKVGTAVKLRRRNFCTARMGYQMTCIKGLLDM